MCSCGVGLKRRDAKPQSDPQRLRQRHPPWASLSSRGKEEAGGGEGGRHAQETEVWVWPSSS